MVMICGGVNRDGSLDSIGRLNVFRRLGF